MKLRLGLALDYDGTDAPDVIATVRRDGFDAAEVNCTAGFPFDERRARQLGDAAAAEDVWLSAHAPYFASLTLPEDDRAARSIGAIEHTVKLGQAMRAPVIVAHTGMFHGQSAEVVLDLARARIRSLAKKIEGRGVAVGLENAGNSRNFGSLGDIALLASDGAPIVPVVDWAHLHAMSNGGLRRVEDFAAVFSFLKDAFPAWALQPLHCQFTDNEFGPGGEKRHVRYGEGTLRISPLIVAAGDAGIDLVIISEAHDTDSHRRIRDEARAAAERGVVGGGLGQPGPGPVMRAGVRMAGSGRAPFEPTLEVVAAGDAHTWTAPDGTEVRIGNIDKPLWPDGATKGDLVEFYARMAPALLPHLAGRPMSMHRQPDGIDDTGFYEKRMPTHAPGWLALSPPWGTDGIAYLLAEDTRTLVWMSSMANIELHPFLSRLPRLDVPSFAAIDLDPFEPITFADVRAVALLVKVALDRLGLRGYPKYSGATGIQIYVPLRPGHTYARSRRFVGALGRALLAVMPDLVTMEWDIAKRAGKVFVDHNMNVGGKTIAAAYSLRPVPWHGVGTPLSWAELDEDIEREDLHWGVIFERLRKFGDLWAPTLAADQDLAAAEAALGLEPLD